MDVKKENSEQKEWRYDAFISYRHLQPDDYVASTVHRLLESYKTPKNLIKEQGDKLKKTEIKKVFRDAEELPLTADLNDTIMDALSNSQYLIVICSPSFKESMWCKKEVETFISLRGKENVFTVLVDGEPEESFPPELMYRDVEVQKPDGSIEIVRQDVEPLAANARGASNKERLKNLKIEILRLIAPMFGCNFDDLKQRHKEQKMKRTMQMVLLIASVCVCFGIFSTIMFYKISQQNEVILERNNQIFEQNLQIQEQSGQIQNQANLIAQQYEEAIYSRNVAQAEVALGLYNQDNRLEALQLAYSIFPGEDNTNPYVHKAEYALTQSLGLYDNGYEIKQNLKMRAHSTIESIWVSPSGYTGVTMDNTDVVEIWDLISGKKLDTIMLEQGDASAKKICLEDDDYVWLCMEHSVGRYNISEHFYEPFVTDTSDVYKLCFNPEKKRLLIAMSDTTLLVNTETKEVLGEYKSELDNYLQLSSYDNLVIKDATCDYFVIKWNPTTDNNTTVYEVHNINDGSLVDTIVLPEYGDEIIVCQGNMICIVNKNYVELEDIVSFDYKCHITQMLVSEQGVEILWESSMDDGNIQDVFMDDHGDYVVMYTYDTIVMLDGHTGEMLRSTLYPNKILTVKPYAEGRFYDVIMSDGQMYITSPELVYDNIDVRWECKEDNLKLAYLGKYIVTVKFHSNSFTTYCLSGSPDLEDFDGEAEKLETGEKLPLELEEAYEEFGVSTGMVRYALREKSGRFMGLSYLNGDMDIFRVDENRMPLERVCRAEDTDVIATDIIISPKEDYIIVAGSSGAYLLRSDDVDLATDFPDWDHVVGQIYGFVAVDFENNMIITKTNSDYKRMPIYTSEEVREYAKHELEIYGILEP